MKENTPVADPKDNVPDNATTSVDVENIDPNEEPFMETVVARAEIERWKDLALRSQADLDNFRKRMARESADSRAYANQALLESLLPILDNFEMGLAAARADSEKSSIFLGMSMVQRQIQDFLRQQGVEEVAAEGDFNPRFHEAVSQEANAEVPEGHIVRVLRKGYRLRERLLRPSMVIISQGVPTAENESAAK